MTMRPTDITIKSVDYQFEDYLYRTPIKFGGVALDRVTLVNVQMMVESLSGRVAIGRGSMPLGNVWAFPSKVMTYAETLEVMKQLCVLCRHVYSAIEEYGHPIDLGLRAEHELLQQMKSIPSREPIPLLASLVVNSAYDAALHDAYGHSLNLNCYQCYSTDYANHDLSHYLGPEFQGEYLDQYLLKKPKASMPLYHLVGALDPLTVDDVKDPIHDSYPEHLGEWIMRDGLSYLKIKLNGDDIHWDFERIIRVDMVATETRLRGHSPEWRYSLDFNERCQNVSYLIELLERIQRTNPVAFSRIQYVEQPTARDLKSKPQNRMHAAAAIKPVVIDESLTDVESLYLAREFGYTGVAFKACKGQTQTLLQAAVAQKLGLFRCVQDLTCPGASLIHSAGIAAHIPGVAAIEANSRQYCPAANQAWIKHYPGIFEIRNGTMNTGLLHGVGLSARWPES